MAALDDAVEGFDPTGTTTPIIPALDQPEPPAQDRIAGETPQQTDKRQQQQDIQQQRSDLKAAQQAKTQSRMSGAEFASRGIPTYRDQTGNIVPVQDQAGQPLTKQDKRNSLAWDSLGNPQSISYDANLGTAPTLSDPYANGNDVTDKQGNTYKVTPGLPWKWTGTDEDVHAAEAQKERDKAVSQAATAVGGKLTLEHHAEVTSAADLKTSTKRFAGLAAVNGLPPDLASTEDPDAGHAVITKAFQDRLASPEAKATKGFFSEELSPEAQQYRAMITDSEAKAHTEFDKLMATKQRASEAAATAQATRDQAQALRTEKANSALERAGITPPDANTAPESQPASSIPGADAVSAPPIPGTEPMEQPNVPRGTNSSDAVASTQQAIEEAKAGKKAYAYDDKEGIHFQPEKMADGLKQAVSDGIVDPKWAADHQEEFQKAQDQYQQLEKDAGGAQVLKALLRGGGTGAAFWAGSIPGAQLGAAGGALVPVLGETGISEVIGGALGGLTTGTIAAFAANKVLDKLGAYSDTIKGLNAAAQLHPVANAAGELLGMSINAPKAVSNLYRAAQIAQQAGTTADAVKLVGKIVGAGAVGGAAFEGAVRPVFDLAKNAVLDQLGVQHDAVQSPTVQSIITNVALGIVTSGHNIEFKDYTAADIASILTRAKVRQAAGIPLDAQVDPGQMAEAASAAGLDMADASRVSAPLSASEMHVFDALGKKAAEMKVSGKYDNSTVTGATATQAVIPDAFGKKETPLTSATIETKASGEAPAESTAPPALHETPSAATNGTAGAQGSTAEPPAPPAGGEGAIIPNETSATPTPEPKPAEPTVEAPTKPIPGMPEKAPEASTPEIAPEIAPEIELAAREKELAAMDAKDPMRPLIEGRVKELRSAIAPSAPTNPGFRHLNSPEASEYNKNGGWKLHLTVNPENYSAVDSWLEKNHPGAYKLLSGGDAGEKDFTIYVGDKKAASELSEKIESQIGDKLAKNNAGSDDAMFTGKVSGRFDVANGGSGLRYYGRDGLPYDKSAKEAEYQIQQADSPEQKAHWQKILGNHEARIHKALSEKYGDRFTGEPAPAPGAETRTPPEQTPAEPSTPAIPGMPTPEGKAPPETTEAAPASPSGEKEPETSPEVTSANAETQSEEEVAPEVEPPKGKKISKPSAPAVAPEPPSKTVVGGVGKAPATTGPKSVELAAETVKADLGKAIKLPENARAIRVLDAKGRPQIFTVKNGDFKGANPMLGEKWSKMEAGNVDSKGRFQVVKDKPELVAPKEPASAAIEPESTAPIPATKKLSSAAQKTKDILGDFLEDDKTPSIPGTKGDIATNENPPDENPKVKEGANPASGGVVGRGDQGIARADSEAVQEHRDELGGSELGGASAGGKNSFTSLANHTKPSEAKQVALIYARDNRAVLDALGVGKINFTTTKHGSGAEFSPNDHEIRFDPDRVAKWMDWIRNDKKDPLSGKALALTWLDHEVIHAAQNQVAINAGISVRQLYTEGWKDADLPTDLRKAARSYYGKEWDDMPEWKQRAEAVRMIIENRWKGKITEAIYNAIKALKDFFNRVLKMHPESTMLKRQVAKAEDVLRKSGAEFKEKPLPNTDEGTLSSASPTAQKTKDILGDMLGAAELSKEESYNEPIPTEKRDALRKWAAVLMDEENIDTPEKLAKTLAQLSPKARTFSQQLWYKLKGEGAQGPSEPDWGKLYSALEPEGESEKQLAADESPAKAIASDVEKTDTEAPTVAAAAPEPDARRLRALELISSKRALKPAEQKEYETLRDQGIHQKQPAATDALSSADKGQLHSRGAEGVRGDHAVRSDARDATGREGAVSEVSKGQDEGLIPAAAPHHSAAMERDEDGTFKPDEVSTARKVLNSIADAAATVKTEAATWPIKDRIRAGYDASGTLAHIAGEQARNSVRLDFHRPAPEAETKAQKKLRRNEVRRDLIAARLIVEAGGDRNALIEDQKKIDASKSAKQRQVWQPIARYAIDNFDYLNEQIKGHEKIANETYDNLISSGEDFGKRENYVHRVTLPPEDMNEVTAPFAMGSGAGNNPKGMEKSRAFDKIADAVKAGYDPGTYGIDQAAQRMVTNAQRIIGSKAFLEEMRSIISPSDEKPIIGEMETIERQNGTKETRVPKGYSVVQVMGRPVVVHNLLADEFKALFGQSALRSNIAGRALLKFVAWTKAYTLVGDTFHAGRMFYKALSSGSGVDINRGMAMIEYSPEDLQRAVKNGEVDKRDAEWATRERGLFQEGLKHGLNIGRIADNLVEQAKTHVPGMNTFNDWLFQKLTRSFMAQGFITYAKRNIASGNFATRDEAIRQAAKETNEVFGNIQNQGIFQNKTLQDISRITLLAPNWTETQARAEARAFGQAGKSAYDFVRSGGKKRFIGNSARTAAIGFGLLLAFNQLVNYFTRGHSTFENEEDGHKFDAFIPGGNRGFWFNPAEIATEFSHAAMKYYAQHENAVDIATHIASNKLSPLARGVKEGLSGRDYAGRHFLSNSDRFTAAAADALPSPLPLGSVLEKDPRQPLGYRISRQPGSIEKQVLQSVGLKVTAAQSPRTQMFELAQPFRPDRGSSDAAGEYTELRRALDNDDLGSAKSEVKWLLDRGKSLDVISHAVGIRKNGSIPPELFTGSQDREAEMLKTFDASEHKIYAAAQKDHLDNAMKFLKIAPEFRAQASPWKPGTAFAKM